MYYCMCILSASQGGEWYCMYYINPIVSSCTLWYWMYYVHPIVSSCILWYCMYYKHPIVSWCTLWYCMYYKHPIVSSCTIWYCMYYTSDCILMYPMVLDVLCVEGVLYFTILAPHMTYMPTRPPRAAPSKIGKYNTSVPLLHIVHPIP